MLVQIDAGPVAHALQHLAATFQIMDTQGPLLQKMQPPGAQFWPDEIRLCLIKDIGVILEYAKRLNLRGSRRAAERAKEYLESFEPTMTMPFAENYDPAMESDAYWLTSVQQMKFIQDYINDVSSRFRDELEGSKFISFSSEASWKLYTVDLPFGEAVADAFPLATSDIVEASKCMALERWTACVFHLMRAAEAAAAIVSLKLGGDVRDERNEPLVFGSLFMQVSAKIDLMPRGPQKDAWLKLKGFMSSVNRGIRTKVAHPGTTYSEEQAKRLFELTKSFMEEAEELLRS